MWTTGSRVPSPNRHHAGLEYRVGARHALRVGPPGRRLSSVRQFEINDDYAATYAYDGTWSSSVTSIDGSAIVLEIDGHYQADGYTTDSAQWEDITCDASGVAVSVVHYAYTYTYDTGTVDEGWQEYTYDPPAVSMPADADEGSTWTRTYNASVVDSTGHTTQYAATTDNALVAGGSVTVPAGTFDTLTWNATTYTQSAYVQDDYGSLVSYTP